jgi:hypothetical protein
VFVVCTIGEVELAEVSYEVAVDDKVDDDDVDVKVGDGVDDNVIDESTVEVIVVDVVMLDVVNRWLFDDLNIGSILPSSFYINEKEAKFKTFL